MEIWQPSYQCIDDQHSLAYKGTAIPLVWKLLGKAGDSSQEERIVLMRGLLWFLSQQQKAQIYALTADRKFIGHKWFTYLIDQQIDFVIGIRKDVLVSKAGHSTHAYNIFATVRLRCLRKSRQVFGLPLYLSGQHLQADKYLILISSIQGKQAVELYAHRWQIELLFACLKSRGFSFQHTHLKEDARINTMIFVLALTLCWAVKTGEWLLENGFKIPVKQLKERKAMLYSLFRIRLDHLKVHMLNHLNFNQLIQLLSCT